MALGAWRVVRVGVARAGVAARGGVAVIGQNRPAVPPRRRRAPHAPLHRPLRAVADRAAARRLGGGGVGELARRPRPRRPLAGADRGRGPAALPARHRPDQPWFQSARGEAYRAALDRLLAAGRAYPCGCSRRDVEQALAAAGQPRVRFAAAVYPGTCRGGLHGRSARAVRLRTTGADGGDVVVAWHDRRLGAQRQNVTHEVGDFVLARADGLWAYQLAVVVDDAAQQVSDVVRGEDLADNTARQVLLQRALGLPTPRDEPLAVLRAAARMLGLPDIAAATPAEWLTAAVPAWAARWVA